MVTITRKLSFVLILVIFSTFIGFSQILNIPDEIFKNYLLGIGIDTNEDGEISSTEANAYTGPIIVDSLNISDLTGITGFINITFLSASYNNLTFLNLGFKYHLDTVIIDHNLLDTLRVGQCGSLKYLKCDHNYLSNVNFAYAIDEIEKLDCSYNEFTKIRFPYYIFNSLKYLDCSNNNITHINLDSLPEVIELDCSFNDIEYINYPEEFNLKILNCSNNNLSELQLPELSILETLNCSYNLFDSLSFTKSLQILNCSSNGLSILTLIDQKQLHYIDFSYNELEDIDLIDCGAADTIICSYNKLTNLSLIYNLKLNWIDFSNNLDLELLCVNHLPITFGISDYGTNYRIEICTQEFQTAFKAGQLLGLLNYNNEGHVFSDTASFDLTGDGIFDIRFTSIRDGLSGYWGNINYYVKPLSPTLMAWDNSMYNNDLIYPQTFSWTNSSNPMHIYYAYGDINGTSESQWFIYGDHFLAFKTPVDGDTIYSYVQLLQVSGWGYFSLNLGSYASWAPCVESISLGNDTLITLKDTLTLSVGNDFENYFWNSGDTTQYYTIIGEEFGVGVWEIGVYVKKSNCYYTDTIQVQIIDDSGISETESKTLRTYPNPTKDWLKIINNGNLECHVSLFDINGRQLTSLELFKEAEIDISQYPKGIYYLYYMTKDDTGSIKIIKL